MDFNNAIKIEEEGDDFSVDVEKEEIETDGDSFLIDLVKRYPHLYNRTSKDYKDVLVKENTWQEISVMMSMPAAECQNRWVRLRERFTKERRMEENDRRFGVPSDYPKRRPWHLFTNMSFLTSHIRKRRSFKAIRPIIRSVQSLVATDMSSSPEEVVCDVELFPEMLPPVETMQSTVESSISTTNTTTTSSPTVTSGSSPVATVEASSTTSTLSLQKLLQTEQTKCQSCEDKQKMKIGDDLEQSLASISSAMFKLLENMSAKKSLDEDDLFGELVTAELKRMKPDEKETVKMELSKILYSRRNSQL